MRPFAQQGRPIDGTRRRPKKPPVASKLTARQHAVRQKGRRQYRLYARSPVTTGDRPDARRQTRFARQASLARRAMALLPQTVPSVPRPFLSTLAPPSLRRPLTRPYVVADGNRDAGRPKAEQARHRLGRLAPPVSPAMPVATGTRPAAVGTRPCPRPGRLSQTARDANPSPKSQPSSFHFSFFGDLPPKETTTPFKAILSPLGALTLGLIQCPPLL